MRRIITQEDIPPSGELLVPEGAVITGFAKEIAASRGVILRFAAAGAAASGKIAIGSDHGGFRMKESLKPLLTELGYSVRDVGVLVEKPVDYPDIAHEVAQLIASGDCLLGIIVDGAGIGSAMVANKVPGVRAALCYDRASAKNSREHNNANVLTLGGRLLTESQAEEVLRTWLATPFAGGRHQSRVDKITEVERRYTSWTPQNSKDL